MKQELSYIVFTDFDGTITVQDIGDKMFQQFGNAQLCEEHFRYYTTGEIDARECWRKSCETVREVTEQDFREFAQRQHIDSGFSHFVQFCSAKNIPVIVVSDGFDAYINTVLNGNGFSDLQRFCNALVFENGKIRPEFPYADEHCRQCANCKRNHLLVNSSDDNVIVYIGDGYSDRCPSKFADIVFAKNSLVSFCESNNITYHRFATFADVLLKFKTIVETTKPKKKLTAEHARKEIYMQG